MNKSWLWMTTLTRPGAAQVLFGMSRLQTVYVHQVVRKACVTHVGRSQAGLVPRGGWPRLHLGLIFVSCNLALMPGIHANSASCCRLILDILVVGRKLGSPGTFSVVLETGLPFTPVIR